MNPPPDTPALEALLRDLDPPSLDAGFLSRLEACAEGTFTSLTLEEARLESQLQAIRPARLAAGDLAGFETLFRNVPFPVDEKIVLFPKAKPGAGAKRSGRPTWAAAAAVALVGAATALLVPATKPARQYTAAPSSAAQSPRLAPDIASNVAPASFDRGVTGVQDEGIVWPNGQQPHNVVRVEYMEKIALTGKDGRSYQVERPRVRYMLVPAHAD